MALACGIYAENGFAASLHLFGWVDFYWLINPGERMLEAFARDEGGWKLVAEAAESEHVRAPPFEAIVLELQAWWTP